MRVKLFLMFFLVRFCFCDEEDSAFYLESAIKNLKSVSKAKNSLPIEIEGSKSSNVLSTAENRVGSQENQIPPLSLTKGELLTIYESAAANKGKILFSPTENPQNVNDFPTTKGADEEEYYYYYFPLKNLLYSDKVPYDPTRETSYSGNENADSWSYHIIKTSTPKTLYNYHSHNHQVNVKVEQVKPMSEKKKALEPLFMAISGFIGMAAMIIVGIFCLPKFGNIKSRSEYDDSNMSRVALQVLNGHDCTERFTCEFGKAAYTFSLHNNRFTKLLRRFVPKFLGKQIDKVKKYSQKKYKCSMVPCKK